MLVRARVGLVFCNLVGLLAAQTALSEVALPKLEEGNFEEVLEHILPRTEELEFRTIPWRVTLAAAATEARAAERPILLWAMNGHPLGCT
jgi:hypothetical protein